MQVKRIFSFLASMFHSIIIFNSEFYYLYRIIERKSSKSLDSIPSSFTGTKLQIPVYKTNYPPKSGETYAPIFQNKKASFPSYLSNLQNQLVLKPTVEDNRFNFGEAGTGEKVNAVQQLGSHFLLPSFQGQVIPISTLANNAPFPRYKGAAIQVYPTVAGFSTTAYQPLQAQQQFQFGHGIVQPVDNSGRPPPSQAEEIRSDVEIIDEKKPRPPPRSDEDDGDQADDDDHGSLIVDDYYYY